MNKLKSQPVNLSERLDIESIILDALADLYFVIHLRAQKLEINHSINLFKNGNRAMFSALIITLIENAVLHSEGHAVIRILMNKNGIIISNSGKAFNIDIKAILDRIGGSIESHKGLGLGLRLASQITQIHSMKLTYCYRLKENIHEFCVLW